MRVPLTLARLSAVTALLGSSALAGPWIDPGNAALRNDIQSLADAGVIDGPVTTWPLAWGDIVADLSADVVEDLGPGERQALLRLRRAERLATGSSNYRRYGRIGAASRPQDLRTFEDTPREGVEARAAVEWTGLRFSYRLQATAVSGADDGRNWRADGSYAGVALGNYMVSIGQLERWWGPGHHGSLILGTNSRPIPAVAIRRNFSDPFQTRWLRWMGPWTVSGLWGQLEGGRTVPDARFFGLRLNFRPTPDLEIGLSRTAQWCGEGRPCDAGTFTDLLLGQDNRGENVTLDNEPGNQLAGVDWRWRLPLTTPLAWYGQLIGEDEAGGLPSRMIAQLGLESWGYSQRLNGTWRAHLEFADTAAEFYKDPVRYDYAYEHFIYKDGYRFRGRSIGHSMDNDGRMIGFGASLDTAEGDQWRGLVRIVDLNRGGSRPNPLAAGTLDLVNVELGYTRPMVRGRLDFGVGVDFVEDRVANTDETDLRAHVSWQGEL